MRRLLFFTIAAFQSFLVTAQIPNTWAQKSDLGYSAANVALERKGAAGFVIGQKAYLGTGANAATKFKDFWEYDPATNFWTQKADFPGAGRSEAVGFSLSGIGYIGTGNTATGYAQDFFAYDPVTNTWSPRAPFAGLARGGATGFSLNGKAYVGTGLDASGYKADFWEYNPTVNTWTPKASFIGLPRSGAISFALGGKGYLGTGVVGSWGGTTNTFYEYNPATNSWLQKANAGTNARGLCASFTIGDKGYVVAGRTGATGLISEVWEYWPFNNTWSSRTSLSPSQNREGAFGFSINNIGYVATGVSINNTYRDDLWQFNFTSNLSWEQQATIGNMGRTLAVGFSIGPKGYMGTGFDGTCKKDLWELDPSTNTWSQKADVPGRARKGAVAFSIGNKGYVGMGQDDRFDYIDDFYEFDPVKNTWKTLPSSFGGWGSNSGNFQAVGFSIGRKGYISNRNSEIREYNPATNTWTLKGYFPLLVYAEAAGFSIGNKGYIGTGTSNVPSKNFFEYDPVTNTVTQKANFPGNARRGALAFATGTKGYMGFGHDNMNAYSDLYEYNPATNTWTRMANPPARLRREPAAFAIGNKGYIGTGYAESNRSLLKDTWEYTSPDTFTDVGIMALSGPAPTGCGLTNQENITVSVFNTGTTTATAVPLGYSVNGVPATGMPEVLAGPILPNTSTNYTFTVPADLSTPGTYTIKVYTLLSADIRPGNDTAEFRITNYRLPGLPALDFQTPANGLSPLRKVTNMHAAIGQGADGSNPPNSPAGQGLVFSNNSGDTTSWVNPTGTISPWTINQHYFAGAYVCFSPAGGAPSDSLWLTFDLNQLHNSNPSNTNFRITVNGQQVGPTYNPQGANSLYNWRRYIVNLYPYRNHATVEIGFESSVRDMNATGAGSANLVDNIQVWRRKSHALSTEDKLPASTLKVYPNPGSGTFNIILPTTNTYELMLYDLTGKMLHCQQASGGKSQLQLNNPKPGVYFLKITSSEGTVVKKLVIN